MRFVISAVVFAACTASSLSAAFGHGFTIFRSGNKIMAESEDNNTVHHGTLNASFEELSGFDALVGGGLNVPSDTFTLELFGPLWYSNGGPAVLAANGTELIVGSFSDGTLSTLLGSASRSAITLSSASLAITGDNDDSMIFALAGTPVAPGVYGIGMRVHGLDEGNPLAPFDPSDPLVITLRTSGFGAGDPATLSDARMAVFEMAVVPEPSGVVLGLVAVAVCFSLSVVRNASRWISN